MRRVEVSRLVAAAPSAVERALDPARVVEYEGTFRVVDVEEASDATLVTAARGGPLRMTLRFDPREDGFYYEQEGEAGPFDRMWTRLRWEPAGEGTRLVAHSGVSLGLPLPRVTDRVAAWKRRGELRRALDRIAADLE